MNKKVFVFLMVVILLMTGCTRITNNLDVIVNEIMDNKSIKTNIVSTRYQLYMPIGVRQIYDNDYNQKFKIGNRYIYLYVDTVSYYYKNSLNLKDDDSYSYYYKEINNNGKIGYIGINKIEDDLYYGEVVYNYSKGEFYADGEELPYILANVLIIQKSIKFDDSLISLELDDDISEGRETKYQLDSPKDAKSTFDDFLQEYVPEDDDDDDNQKTEVELPDQG